jgi:hypothetical protein
MVPKFSQIRWSYRSLRVRLLRLRKRKESLLQSEYSSHAISLSKSSLTRVGENASLQREILKPAGFRCRFMKLWYETRVFFLDSDMTLA